MFLQNILRLRKTKKKNRKNTGFCELSSRDRIGDKRVDNCAMKKRKKKKKAKEKRKALISMFFLLLRKNLEKVIFSFFFFLSF